MEIYYEKIVTHILAKIISSTNLECLQEKEEDKKPKPTLKNVR